MNWPIRILVICCIWILPAWAVEPHEIGRSTFDLKAEGWEISEPLSIQEIEGKLHNELEKTWIEFKRDIKPEDSLVFFQTPPVSTHRAFAYGGIAHVRKGIVIKTLVSLRG